MPSGRLRKPTKVLEREGAFVKHPDRRRPGEPDPDPHEPEMPAGLDAMGKRAWVDICGYLRVMGILSKSDTAMLELYARSYSSYRKCETKVSKEGVVSGGRRNPWDRAKLEHLNVMMRILGRFGLSPADRAGLDITKAADASADPFIKLAQIGKEAG